MVGQQFTLHFGLVTDKDENENSDPVGNQRQNHGRGQEAQPSSPAVVVKDRHYGGEQDGNGKVANTGAAIGNDQAAIGQGDAVAFNQCGHPEQSNPVPHHGACNGDQGGDEICPDRQGTPEQDNVGSHAQRAVKTLQRPTGGRQAGGQH